MKYYSEESIQQWASEHDVDEEAAVKQWASLEKHTWSTPPKDDPQAWFDHGSALYRQGFHAEAAKWCRKAAEQGLAEAQYKLGLKYENGWGVPINHAEAVKWLSLAAEQGLAEAQFNLALKYDEGYGVPENDAEAVKWYRKAAEQRHAGAQHCLDMMRVKD